MRPSPNPAYTVAICTWNRAEVLPACIASVAAQLSAPAYEILVVDNASTDGTQELVAQLAGRTPGLRLTVEPEAGLAHARNRALREADADVVVFLDDDARADPGWLRGYHAAWHDRPAVACAGGPIRLDWTRARPPWFPPFALLYLGELDLGNQPRPLSRRERPRGINMSVRRDVALSLGGFRPALGRRGNSLLSGEDDEFVERLRRAGHGIWWEPGASVVHVVDASRLSVRWLTRRAWMQGRTEVIIERDLVESAARPPRFATATELAKAAGHLAEAAMFVATQPERSRNEVVHFVATLGRAWSQATAAVARLA